MGYGKRGRGRGGRIYTTYANSHVTKSYSYNKSNYEYSHFKDYSYSKELEHVNESRNSTNHYSYQFYYESGGHSKWSHRGHFRGGYRGRHKSCGANGRNPGRTPRFHSTSPKPRRSMSQGRQHNGNNYQRFPNEAQTNNSLVSSHQMAPVPPLPDPSEPSPRVDKAPTEGDAYGCLTVEVETGAVELLADLEDCSLVAGGEKDGGHIVHLHINPGTTINFTTQDGHVQSISGELAGRGVRAEHIR